MNDTLHQSIRALAQLDSGLHDGDFLLTWNIPEDDLRAVLLATEILETMYRTGLDTRVFRTGLAVSLFRDKSTRTRFSFASAASLLGLSLTDLDEAKSQVAHGETVRETANMISFLTEVIGIRDDLFIGEGHEYMSSVATALHEGFTDGVLPQRPAVVNLQCDRDHPTQSMADLMHLQQTFGSLSALRGKRLALTWAYSPSYGKPLSVPQGIIGLMTRFGMEVVLAHPQGYDLMPEIVETARRQAEASGGLFRHVETMEEAFADADVVYPKSWAPLRVMAKRTELLRAGEGHRVDELEREAIEENSRHLGWECSEALMKSTRNGSALYMHCLPADISGVSCERGEVAASVFDRYRVATYREAEHKPYVIAAIMLLTRIADPAGRLLEVVKQARRRS